MKIAIVNLSNQRVQFVYEAESVNIKSFGGPWGDPQVVEHVKIPDSVQFTSNDELEPYNGQEQDGVQIIQDGEEPAYDSQNKPMKDQSGQTIMIPKYIEQPIMKPMRLMRRKQ